MEKVSTCGIDLGTTNSAVGIVKNGVIELSTDKTGKKLIPSYVAYPPNAKPPFLVGATARARMATRPDGVIYDCKRLIGMNYNDEVVERMRKYASFDIVDDGNNKPLISVKQNGETTTKTPEEVGAIILRYLKEQIREYAGNPDLNDVVITVPAYFNQKQRQATKDAGTIAGLNVLEIISEPVAAAYAYADQNDIGADDKEKTILIYDLGGGTFDVTIMTVKGNNYREIGLDGDLFLGGSDFDVIIMEEVIRAYNEENPKPLNNKQRGKLRSKCEDAKVMLRAVDVIEIEVNDDFMFTLSRQTMESLLRPHIQKTIDICDKLITKCNKTINDIDDIVLVGGSTRLNIVHEMLTEHFHKKLLETINPDECVAYGATKYAYSITHGINPTVTTDIQTENQPDARPAMQPVNVDITCPSDIGVNVGGRMKAVIPRGTALPYKNHIMCTNTESYVTELLIDILQGNHRRASHNAKLHTIRIPDIEPRAKGKNMILIFLSMDKNGTLSASVADFDTGKQIDAPNIQANLSEEELARMQERRKEERRMNAKYQQLIEKVNNVQMVFMQRREEITDPSKQERIDVICNQLAKCSSLEEVEAYEREILNM